MSGDAPPEGRVAVELPCLAGEVDGHAFEFRHVPGRGPVGEEGFPVSAAPGPAAVIMPEPVVATDGAAPAPLRLLPDAVPVRHPGEGSSRHQEAPLERRPERDRRRQARVRHRGEQYWLSDRLALPIGVSAGCQALLHSGQVNWGQGWRRPSSVASRAAPPASIALRRAFMVRQALVLHAVEQYRRLFLDPQGRGVPHWLQRRVFLLTTSPDCPSPIGSRPSRLDAPFAERQALSASGKGI